MVRLRAEGGALSGIQGAHRHAKASENLEEKRSLWGLQRGERCLWGGERTRSVDIKPRKTYSIEMATAMEAGIAGHVWELSEL